MSKPMLSFCEKTIKHLKQVIHQHNCKSVLIGVKAGGCNGLKYSITPINNTFNIDSELIKMDDLDIHICNRSMMYLIGTKLIWEDSPMGGGISFINPNAVGKCGCGETFTPGKPNHSK